MLGLVGAWVGGCLGWWVDIKHMFIGVMGFINNRLLLDGKLVLGGRKPCVRPLLGL